MTRFNIGGEYLDTPRDLALTFSKKNILFAFDNIECEYTSSFDIPKTAKNERLMRYASNIHTTGEMMRVKIDAQMQNGVVAKDGYIYLDSYDNEKDAYKAVFVTGELLKLKDIRDAGSIADYLNTELYVSYSQANQKNANTNDVQSMPYGCVRYKQDFVGLCKPSPMIDSIVSACAQHFGVQVTGASMAGVRIVPTEMGTITNKPVTITSVQGTSIISDTNKAVNTSYTTNAVCLKPTTIPFEHSWLRLRYEGTSVHWEYGGYNFTQNTLAGWEVVEDTEIQIPNNVTSNIYMMSKIGVYGNVGGAFNIGEFYGGHSFEVSDIGEVFPLDDDTLAGKKIQLTKGQKFAFFDINDISAEDAFDPQYMADQFVDAIHYSHAGQSYFTNGQPTYSMTVSVTHTYQIEIGSNVYLDGNLPDVTFNDILKFISAIKGKQLLYTDSGGIQFVDLNFDTWKTIKLTNVIAAKTMSRKFSDYAQVNKITFDDDAGVFAWEVLSDEYNIHNENLDAEKTIASIPFSEGGVYNDNDKPVGYIRFNADEDFGNTSIPYIFKTNRTDGSVYMSRISIGKNTGIQQLCDVSSTIVVTARMSLLQYNQITPTTALWYDGSKYVWTEAQWSKDIATLTLSKY